MRFSEMRNLEESYRPRCPDCGELLRPDDEVSPAEAKALGAGKRPAYVSHAGKCPD